MPARFIVDKYSAEPAEKNSTAVGKGTPIV